MFWHYVDEVYMFSEMQPQYGAGFMSFQRDKPYNTLPLLPPSGAVETESVLRRVVPAARALAELKHAGQQLPNQTVLINTIPLLEAQVSSEIENVVTTSDKLFRLAANEKADADPATKEALRYRTALRAGYESLQHRPLSTRTAIDVCSTIRGVETPLRHGADTVVANPGTGRIIYTPPEGPEHVQRLLTNWSEYINTEHGPDPLIKMAIMHYQFEAIHPFTDGNGRTGRILNILYLVHAGLLSIPVLYLSRYILANRQDYYRLLREVTENENWEAWIVYMLEAVEETSRWTCRRVMAIDRLFQHTCAYLRETLPNVYSRELVEVLFNQPYARISNLVEAGIAKRQTASTYMRQLTKAGVLQETRAGKEKLFVHTKFLDLLLRESDDYAPYPD